jgi:hypothetical protein
MKERLAMSTKAVDKSVYNPTFQRLCRAVFGLLVEMQIIWAKPNAFFRPVANSCRNRDCSGPFIALTSAGDGWQDRT